MHSTPRGPRRALRILLASTLAGGTMILAPSAVSAADDWDNPAAASNQVPTHCGSDPGKKLESGFSGRSVDRAWLEGHVPERHTLTTVVLNGGSPDPDRNQDPDGRSKTFTAPFAAQLAREAHGISNIIICWTPAGPESTTPPTPVVADGVLTFMTECPEASSEADPAVANWRFRNRTPAPLEWQYEIYSQGWQPGGILDTAVEGQQPETFFTTPWNSGTVRVRYRIADTDGTWMITQKAHGGVKTGGSYDQYCAAQVPETPEQPENPETPETPDRPETPETPDQPDEPGTDQPGTDQPETDQPEVTETVEVQTPTSVEQGHQVDQPEQLGSAAPAAGAQTLDRPAQGRPPVATPTPTSPTAPAAVEAVQPPLAPAPTAEVAPVAVLPATGASTGVIAALAALLLGLGTGIHRISRRRIG